MLTRRSFVGLLPAFYASVKGMAHQAAAAREYHVSPQGNDAQDGSVSHPLRTISAAAARAVAGDVITVHAGIYRERVAPPRGGTSDSNRIVYQAAAGEHVVVTGAEIVKGWKQLQGDIWQAVVPNSFFGDFNPYNDAIHGDWFNPKGRVHHTGAVYLDGEWLAEAANLDDVLQKSDGLPLWFGRVDENTTTIWAQFRGADPNQRKAEINVRQTVFYPEKTGINYITVRGFTLKQAATPWAPPTAEQIGAIGTHWSKGWIIENNIVSHSICSGISLGKYGDQWDNTSANTAEGYVKTIERALRSGWSKENVGGHIVRNNTISHCEQTGIVGSLGPVFSVVTGNTIHDIHVRNLFSGAEMAGIKFHAAIDVEISHNHIYRCNTGLWLDWMAQGARVTSNLFHDNLGEDTFLEVDHGPWLVDNNFFLSKISQHIDSHGGAYVHNLFCGAMNVSRSDRRMTPIMKPHSTAVAGYHDVPGGDLRFFNNIVAGNCDMSAFNQTILPLHFSGNVYVQGGKPSTQDTGALLRPEFDLKIELADANSEGVLTVSLDKEWLAAQAHPLVTTELLGRAAIPGLPFERPDGSPLRVDRDYSGRARNRENPFPGPLESPEGGRREVRSIAR